MKRMSSKQSVKSQFKSQIRIVTGVSGLKNWHRNKAFNRRLSNDSVSRSAQAKAMTLAKQLRSQTHNPEAKQT